jgi:hypothetical protein
METTGSTDRDNAGVEQSRNGDQIEINGAKKIQKRRLLIIW